MGGATESAVTELRPMSLQRKLVTYDRTMDATELDQAADILIDARTARRVLDHLPLDVAPRTPAEAAQIEDRVAEKSGWPVLGWKIGCTSEHAQQLLGATEPFAGRVYSTFSSGVELTDTELMVAPRLEGEFAFVLDADLAPRPGGFSRNDVLLAVGELRPAIEVIGGRFADFFGTDLFSVMADAGGNSHLVLGEPALDWSSDELAGVKATMHVDDALTGEGTGADVLGHPLHALLWLANHLNDRNIALRAGDVVTTGTATQVAELHVGSEATADFGPIGSVSLSRT